MGLTLMTSVLYLWKLISQVPTYTEATMSDVDMRKMNLIDMLVDDHEDVEEPAEHLVKIWSEDHIRQYFESGGSLDGLPTPVLAPSPEEAPSPSPEEVDM